MATTADTNNTSTIETPIRTQIASKTIEAMSLKQKLKSALHASTVQAMRSFQGQTLTNMKRNADAAYQAIHGVSTTRAKEASTDEEESMGPMILGDYTVHQAVPLPQKGSLGGEALKLAAAAALTSAGIGLPAYALWQLGQQMEKEVVPDERSFQDATLELSLPYERLNTSSGQEQQP